MVDQRQQDEERFRERMRARREGAAGTNGTGGHASDHPSHGEREGELPRIVIGVDEARVNDEAVDALAGDRRIFQRSNQLVHVLRDQEKVERVIRPPDAPRIAPLPNALLREMMAANASWVLKRKGRGDEVYYVQAHPPDWSVCGVAARGQWPELPYLEAVVESPTFRPDGSVLETAGWDAATGLLFEPRIDFPAVSEKPSQIDAFVAAEKLLDLVNDFPFVKGDDGEHRAAWLASLLTPLARFAFSGPAPLFLFTATAPGSGKSLLTSLVSEIVEGREMARTPYPFKDEEMAKTITAVALAGDRLMLLDNIASGFPFGCASLDAALTATSWRARILGVSQMTPALPLFTGWYASGNNIILRGDIVRRVIPIRLEATEENPELRHNFKYPDLIGHVRRNRAELVIAALTILRGYFAAGKPKTELTPLGSFEGWSDTVRASIFWATGRDPAATRLELEEADEGRSTLATILEGWSQLPEGTGDGHTIAEALRLVRDDEFVAAPQYGVLRDALMAISNEKKLPKPHQLGNLFRTFRGRILNGRSLKGHFDRDKFVYWKVVGERKK